VGVVVYSEMTGYRTSEVAEVIGLSPRQVREYVYAGLLSPVRGPHREYRFSFQDLVLLRMGRQLAASRVPLRRLSRALHRLRGQLPDDLPLSAVAVDAMGEAVIARDRDGVWDPETGQRYFSFTLPPPHTAQPARAREVAEAAGDGPQVTALASAQLGREAEARASRNAREADRWYDRGLDFEDHSLEQAKAAYARALDLNPEHPEAHGNLGRILHHEGRLNEAATHYAEALASDPDSPTAAFNLGVALEDLGRLDEAIQAYHKALVADPKLASAHFNLSRLYESTGDPTAALRHLSDYRRLGGST
jgi:tetratricopeptide (TPR) repeat protein